MKRLNIAEVRKHLPSIVEEVAQSNDAVVITRYGEPMASIVPFRAETSRQARYPLRGHPITVADDFDASMAEQWQALAAAEDDGTYVVRRRHAPDSSTGSAAKPVRRRSKTRRR